MADFCSIAGFPKVIGAIDDALIPIRGPNRDEHLCVCHNSFHALNVMAVCNAHLSFTNLCMTRVILMPVICKYIWRVEETVGMEFRHT